MSLSYADHSALFWAPVFVCTLVLGLRFSIRLKAHNLGLDDCSMAISWCLLILAIGMAQAVVLTNPPTHSRDRPLVPLYNRERVTESVSLVLCLFFGKLGVATMLLRLIGPTHHNLRILIYVTLGVLGLAAVLNVVTIIMPWCEDDTDTWVVSTCVPNADTIEGFSHFWNFYSAAFDILFSLLPFAIIHKLWMSRRKKAAIIISLSLGWIASTFALLRAVTALVWPPKSERLAFVNDLASVLEPCIVIICGSVAALSSIFDFWRKRSLGGRGEKATSEQVIHGGPDDVGLREEDQPPLPALMLSVPGANEPMEREVTHVGIESRL